MLDFDKVRNKEKTYQELSAGLSTEDLAALTNEMIDTIQALLADATDDDVTFQPVDPDAHDAAAATEEETDMAWTLGHIIVHINASYEETAFLAAEAARGVPYHGRSRYERHWTTAKTIAQCRQWLEVSRTMMLASLRMWPPEPHMEIVVESSWAGTVDPVTRYVLGLSHAESHLDQIKEVLRQSRSQKSS